MKIEEAKKVMRIMLDADGGCQYCSASLIRTFVTNFPQFKDYAEDVYHEEFEGYDLWEMGL